ncbi:MAG: GAF domain-containing protein [Cyanobacteria bacterium P01_A01_bin.135]
MKFFKLNASPTVQWMKQVVASEPPDPPADGVQSTSPRSIPTDEPDALQAIAVEDPVPPEEAVQDPDSLQTPSPQTMQLKKSEDRLSLPTGFDKPINSSDRSHELSPHLSSAADQDLLEVAQRLSQTQRLEDLLALATTAVRQHLKIDRALVYRFQAEDKGTVIAEALTKGYTPSLGEQLPAVAFGAETAQAARQKVALEDVAKGDLSPYQQQMMGQFQTRASLSLPLILGEIWGLLVVQCCDQPRAWSEADLTLLQNMVVELRLNLQRVQEQARQQRQAQQQQLMDKVVDRITRSPNLQQTLTNTCREIRRFLGTDRTAIYRFDIASGYSDGETIAEDVEPGCASALAVSIRDHCFEENFVEDYEGGRIWRIANIQESGLDDCLVEILARFQAKASLVVPLLKDDKLWGLFYNHQCSSPRQWQDSEVEFVKRIAAQLNTAIQQGEYIAELERQSEQLRDVAEQEQLIGQIVDRIRQSIELQQAFDTTTREIRSFLQADRVAIFKFNADSDYSKGKTIAEAVRPGYVSALEVEVEDHCFSQGFAEKYRRGHVSKIDNIYEAGIQQCYIDVLAQFQVQANLVVPLMQGDELWGLFCIHQCEQPRQWQEREIAFAKRIAAQLDIAIQQGDYISELQAQSAQLTQAVERNKAAKEELQQQVIQLLSAVRPALDGDLTVRAPVTESAVGTVADAYNNTLGSLRQLVLQMQAAAGQVTETSQASGAAIVQLTEQAQGQFRTLAAALAELQTMAQATQAVEVNAQQVEVAVQQANQTVLTGDAAIDRTVDEMQQIRGTVAETNKRLKRLGESSQKISKVVSLISNFTTQTQLLALNASIEATRAGEYGRGFAVVADEVRSLARQSAEAATDIEQLVQEIQASTSAVADAMEDGIQRVASGTTVVNEARQSLNAIIDATGQISQLVSGITAATQTQTHQCQSMTQTMREVADVANQTSEDSVNISTAFQTLLTTAQSLQSTSQQFRVN